MLNSSMPKNVRIYSPKEVASWKTRRENVAKGRDSAPSPVNIPPVQRGLVWDANQIELFWDSLLRGMPFGALVFADLKNGTYDLLDGQQRCDAMYWGIYKEFPEHAENQILWFDLLPEDRLQSTNRKFLLRLTTKAHPWGFWRDDDASALPLNHRKQFFERLEEIDPTFKVETDSALPQSARRPRPDQCVPFDAGLPVPLPLLFRYCDPDTRRIDWEKLEEKELLVQLALRWKNQRFKNVGDSMRSKVERAIQTVLDTPVVSVILDGVQADDDDRIEQLFVRLNRNGTRLSNEELAYSMIKVSWREDGQEESPIVDTMHAIDADKRMHTSEARLISMGMRVALSGDTNGGRQKLGDPLNPAQIRRAFSEIRDSETEIRWRDSLKTFFELRDGDAKILRSLRWIDEHFLFKDNRQYGIPAYLRSALAWNSPDVFAWLMLQADRYGYDPIDDQTVKSILGLALSVHWFGEHKNHAINRLVELTRDKKLQDICLSDIKDPHEHRTLLWPVLTPEKLGEAIRMDETNPDRGTLPDALLRDWTDSIWQGVVKLREKDQSGGEAYISIGMSVERVRRQFDLLVYAQRIYMEKIFQGFDPSDQSMWKGHNRPWDYDHILASNLLNATGKGGVDRPYHKVCKLWQESIGNFVAIDLSHNRGASDDDPEAKRKLYRELAEGVSWNPLLDLDESTPSSRDSGPKLSDYALTLEDTRTLPESTRYVHACQKRTVELYREWFDTLGVGKLVSAPQSS